MQPRSSLSKARQRRRLANAVWSVTSTARNMAISAVPSTTLMRWAARVATLLTRHANRNFCWLRNSLSSVLTAILSLSKISHVLFVTGWSRAWCDAPTATTSFLVKQVRATANQDQVCFKCHADKAGPFAFEHEPVKTEGCSACHQPHGSTNPRLLRRTQVSLLCLECHTFTQDSSAPVMPSFHNQSQKYQACTLCHLTVHGSNTDRFFFK